MKNVKQFIEDGQHPRTVIKGIRQSCNLALKSIEELKVSQEGDKFRQLLEKCAGTALNSKLIARQKSLFAPMVVDAVLSLDEKLTDIRMVGIKKITGGSVTDSHPSCRELLLRRRSHTLVRAAAQTSIESQDFVPQR